MSVPPPFPRSSGIRFPAPAQQAAASGWWREPLLHFLVLGGLLFGIDHYLVGRADDPHTIVVDAAVDNEARAVFKASRGREPGAQELYALRQVWLDNEVLYREGLALQVDKGDPAIRDRVVFKALNVVDASLELPPFDEQVLRDWFENNRAKYDEPARYDFQEAVLADNAGDGAASAFVDALNAGNPGAAQADLRVFKGRPHDNLVQSYGAEFAEALDAAPVGEWRVLRGGGALRAIRLESITAPRPAVFETLRGVVLQDWTDATMAELRTRAIRALARNYTVKLEAATP